MPFAAAQTVGSCPVLPADNIWNTPVDQLPVAPGSSTYIATIGATAGVHADFGAGLWNGGPIGIPYVVVPGTQTKYPATFLYAGESDPGPYAIPLNAPIEGGSASTGDRHAIAIDTGNCILYELYRAFPQTAGWRGDSGAIYNLLSNNLRPATWTSADAAGLPIFPGLVRYDEILAGEIRHAIRVTVPQTLRAYVWPARHHASGLTDPKYPPMGTRFRLRADFNISGYSPVNQIILRAMKTYGLMLADNGSAWYIAGAPDERWNNNDLRLLGNIKGSDFQVVDVTPLMVSPDSGQARQSSVLVTVSPSSASVTVNTARQFTATVAGNAGTSVTWDVNGIVGGNSVAGWVSPTGLYTAPSAVPSPATVNVRAVSNAVPAANGSAAVTVAPMQVATVSVSPKETQVKLNRTRQFLATVTGTTNTAVVWSVNGITGGNAIIGTIGSAGLYRAPPSIPAGGSVTIRATSVTTPATSAGASVTFRR